jgi:hypothetical protein
LQTPEELQFEKKEENEEIETKIFSVGAEQKPGQRFSVSSIHFIF